jgi:hypothetical protein
MVTGAPTKTVPERISVGWAVPAGFASSGTVSRNMIAGRNALLSEVANAGERYNEHWLVPDGAEVMCRKARDLCNALKGMKGNLGYDSTLNLPSKNYWLLQPKGKNAVTLSAILAYLLVKIPGPEHIDVMWTCCRSPIGGVSDMIVEIHSPFTAYEFKRKEGTKIAEPKQAGQGWTINKHHCAEGTVTLVQGSKWSTLKNAETWPGMPSTSSNTGILKNGELDFLINLPLPN